ncbi:hypothetical protein ASPZODRAFT_141599 [Penicilliopsis zonata CBS 506.65]|uniref:Uncharacterized protein n=1 Tax=Penicilliopsis zonata CBS 506.65 TaxID=1073090 RepID=A0A1L9SLX9_9EURO|nr:hypothetical protein ASPZODRAFT_141599 [Penicilliopsis zonata CBS 506.65]OJJ48057.1 hypothetical protein ASPZODRAFT_141599 [Penicilliopsis zonata CBS 506.65]
MPVPLSFTSRLDRLARLSKVCITTENFGLFDAILAHNLIDPIDHLATLQSAAANDPLATLEQVSLSQVKDVETAFSDGLTELANTVDKTIDQNIIHAALMTFTTSMKDQSNNASDKAYRAAKQIISVLPEPARDSAVKLFTAACGVVAMLNSQQMNLIGDLARGPWGDSTPQTISNAHAANGAAAESASDWIRSLYAG